MQNLFHDGGFSNMGISDAIMDDFMESQHNEQNPS